MILEEGKEVTAEQANKLQAKAEENFQKNPVMPDSNAFKRNLQEFQRRLSNKQAVEKFNSNVLSTNKKGSAAQNKLDLGKHHKMTLGVQREEEDIDGRKFLRVPATNEAVF